MVGKKSTHVIYECSQREADESVLSAETSSSSGLGKEEKPSKYRLIDATKYYIVEEDVSDDEDIDPKHYQTPTYQRSVKFIYSTLCITIFFVKSQCSVLDFCYLTFFSKHC